MLRDLELDASPGKALGAKRGSGLLGDGPEPRSGRDGRGRAEPEELTAVDVGMHG